MTADTPAPRDDIRVLSYDGDVCVGAGNHEVRIPVAEVERVAAEMLTMGARLEMQQRMGAP